MECIETIRLTEEQKENILVLWNREYPIALYHNDITSFEAYLNRLQDTRHILIQDHNGTLLGWYFDFLRDNERWFAMIVASKHQGQGHGRKLLESGKNRNDILNGWVIDHNRALKQNGDPYRSPLSFYLKNEFQLLSEIRLELPGLSAVKIQWTAESGAN